MSKRNIDYAYKSYVLREHSDLLIKTRKSTLYDYAINTLIDTGEVLPVLMDSKGEVITSNDLSVECRELGLEKEFKECKKINKASCYRVKRLRNRVESMLLGGACIFLTLTFTDEVLSSTSEITRRRYVARYLKSFGVPYLANIDFGKENHREHYHAIICAEHIDYSKWLYGAINGEKIRNRDISTDSKKLAKYVCKLSNHAIKETTKRSSLLYSR